MRTKIKQLIINDINNIARNQAVKDLKNGCSRRYSELANEVLAIELCDLVESVLQGHLEEISNSDILTYTRLYASAYDTAIIVETALKNALGV